VKSAGFRGRGFGRGAPIGMAWRAPFLFLRPGVGVCGIHPTFGWRFPVLGHGPPWLGSPGRRWGFERDGRWCFRVAGKKNFREPGGPKEGRGGNGRDWDNPACSTPGARAEGGGKPGFTAHGGSPPNGGRKPVGNPTWAPRFGPHPGKFPVPGTRAVNLKRLDWFGPLGSVGGARLERFGGPTAGFIRFWAIFLTRLVVSSFGADNRGETGRGPACFVAAGSIFVVGHRPPALARPGDLVAEKKAGLGSSRAVSARRPLMSGGSAGNSNRAGRAGGALNWWLTGSFTGIGTRLGPRPGQGKDLLGVRGVDSRETHYCPVVSVSSEQVPGGE